MQATNPLPTAYTCRAQRYLAWVSRQLVSVPSL
jgi:hypothetical protein